MTGGPPVVDVAALRARTGEREAVARAIDRAAREVGFFHVVGHGVGPHLVERLDAASRRFFALPAERKLAIRMERGGRAWRGYFPVGEELTDGRPDQKEGLYLGTELGPEDPRVRAGTPLHGSNLFPDEDVPELRGAVRTYMEALTGLGHLLMEGFALALGLPADAFARACTAEPTVLFRIFHYPVLAPGAGDDAWSVGEHTDYGLVTILHQDAVGGLELRSRDAWIPVPPVPGAFLCNLGDTLERMTRGRYRSTRHRVRNAGDRGRLSLAFFFDPGFDAVVRPIDGQPGESEGTYGEYLLDKVSRVFPELFRSL